MHKTVENGVVRINDLSFHEFSRQLYGFEIQKNGFTVPRFILFWKGLTIAQVKTHYTLVKRV